ncbi:hypothetical protein QFZ82_001619 [Streptomyces sp. V4I23]|uniref:hypothetical protein n=1 Tax=Streptomyces sp. V4I23 TaxID=3042282 RepID=UPI0027842018|nr:hypothetical protein [Streptomyces sp. V4I23]MDQ1007134.1 hypothetical protein [Streptomyces sp. V4I23]
MSTTVPPLWFRLPPGYHEYDDFGPEDQQAIASALLPAILDDPADVDSAERQLAAMNNLLRAMRQEATVHLSLGVHPDEEHGAAFSVFCISVSGIQWRPAAMAVAQSALALADSPRWRSNSGRILDLPSGQPAALVSGTLSAPPRQLLQSAGILAEPCETFQARLTVPFPMGTYVAVADITSAATRHAAAYTDILEAIAGTISFTAPSLPSSPSQRPSRLLELF